MDAEFLEVLLHDLRGPVSRCRILGELLVRQTPDLPEETRTLVQHIEGSATAAENVLEAVRRFANAVGLSFQPAYFELRLAVDGAVARLTSQIAAAGAQVTYRELPVIYGDRAQMTVLFEELIGNALRFRSGEALRIEIAAAPVEQDTQWQISIADNGIGLPEQNPSRVFRPLAKRDANARPGIGLTICRHIAKLHGGELTAVPLAHGAEFRLRLPQSQTAAAGRPGVAFGL